MNESEDILEFGINRENEERRDGGCGVIFDPQSQKYAVGMDGVTGLLVLFGGGVNLEEDIKDGVLREVREESGLHDFVYTEKMAEVECHYFNNVKNINRVARAVCFLFVLKSTKTVPTQLEEHEKISLLWATPEEILSNWKSRNKNKDYDHWIYFLKKSVNCTIELGYDTSNSIYSNILSGEV